MKITEGNIFDDLGFEKSEVENLKIRSELMIKLSAFIEESKLSQSAAAELFGVSQPRISDLIRGKIGLFTVDTLINLLFKAGIRVTLSLDKVA